MLIYKVHHFYLFKKLKKIKIIIDANYYILIFIQKNRRVSKHTHELVLKS